MNGRQVRHGLAVLLESGRSRDDGVWEVLDRAPAPAHWWLHRWRGGVWEAVAAHARNLEPATARD